MPQSNERLLTVDEVAELLQLPKRSIYSQRARGVEPGALGIAVGRYVRFRALDLDRYIEAQATQRPSGSR